MIFRLLRIRREKAFKAARQTASAPSILTADVDIEGNLVSVGELQIDGAVHGDVQAHAAVVDVNGVVHGGVMAEEVSVRGRVAGPVRGTHVHIFSTAHVEGDVVSTTLSIEAGAWVGGLIHHSDEPLAVPAAHPYGDARSWPPAAPYGLARDRGYARDAVAPRPAFAGRKAAE